MLEKHSTAAPTQHTGANKRRTDTIERVIRVFSQLEPEARQVSLALAEGLVARDSAQIKQALDRGIELYGSNETTLGFYNAFGIVPYVLGAQS